MWIQIKIWLVKYTRALFAFPLCSSAPLPFWGYGIMAGGASFPFGVPFSRKSHFFSEKYTIKSSLVLFYFHFCILFPFSIVLCSILWDYWATRVRTECFITRRLGIVFLKLLVFRIFSHEEVPMFIAVWSNSRA